jgi:hypothetical protein
MKHKNSQSLACSCARRDKNITLLSPLPSIMGIKWNLNAFSLPWLSAPGVIPDWTVTPAYASSTK